ncbi:MAG: hypothetical protein SWX82_00880 [Cyanobacteriota bacterium]|nr:hypothetical protein [Cyanobacteriota bacterium]
MEIVKQTEKELALKDNLFDYYAISLFFVSPFIAVSLLITSTILSKMGVIKASCQRVEPTQVNCQVNKSNYLGLIPGSSTSLTRVTEAKLNSQKKKDNDADTYSDYFVTLVSQTGKEVVSWWDDPQEIMEMVVKINTFINYSTEPSLLIQYDLRWKWRNILLLAIGITSIGTEILVLAVLYLKTLILNKSERKLTYKICSLLKLYTETKHYSFAQIQELILENDENQVYELKLVLPPENHQREISLIKDSDVEKVKKLANFVADFIEIPYKEVSNE